MLWCGWKLLPKLNHPLRLEKIPWRTLRYCTRKVVAKTKNKLKYVHLHFDVEVSVTLLDSLSNNLNGSVQLGDALRSVEGGRCHDVLGRGYQVDLDWHLLCRLGQARFKGSFHSVDTFVPIARHLDVWQRRCEKKEQYSLPPLHTHTHTRTHTEVYLKSMNALLNCQGHIIVPLTVIHVHSSKCFVLHHRRMLLCCCIFLFCHQCSLALQTLGNYSSLSFDINLHVHGVGWTFYGIGGLATCTDTLF